MFDSTVGGVTANSYISIDQADDYHALRLHNAEWAAASLADRQNALVMATRYLDPFKWLGTKAASTQALRWPRSGVYDLDSNLYADDAIPAPLVDATAELAWEFLKKDRLVDSDSDGLKMVKAGPVEVEFDSQSKPTTSPKYVLTILANLLETGFNPRYVKLVRA
jgi:hypothetical protein